MQLDVAVTGPHGSNSAGYFDDPFRMEVHGDGTGAGTAIGEIQETLRDTYRPDKRAVTGWPVLLVNNLPLKCDISSTIAKEMLFGKRVSCCIEDPGQ